MANPCTRCGRVHPKGKKQRSKAIEHGFKCRDITTRRAQQAAVTAGTRIRFTPMEQQKRDAKHAVMKDQHAMMKEENIKMMLERHKNKRSPQEQLKELDNRLGVGVGAKKERKRLAEAIQKCKKK